MKASSLSRWLWLAWVAGPVPAVWQFWLATSGRLGADPAKTLVQHIGWWAFCWLVASLSIRPLVTLTRQGWLMPLRRTFGLLCFGYASLHLLAWAWFLLGWDITFIGKELSKRPYIIVGFVAWLMLLPLAVTSTRKARRRLGRRWTRLHKLVYGVAPLVLVHDIWVQKSDIGQPLVFACLLGGLFGWRWWHARQRRPAAVS